MPKSRLRKTAAFTPPPGPSAGPKTNPAWLVPTMLALMLVGLAWIVVTYISGSRYPIPEIGQLNLAIGFAFVIAGFGLTTRWQ